MTRRSLLLSIPILGSAAHIPSATPLTARANADIPQGHWVYDGITDLRKLGFEPGLPDLTLKGKRFYRWIDAAEYTANMIAQVDHVFALGWPYQWRRGGRYKGFFSLSRLVTELEPEIRALRRRTRSFIRDLDIAERFWEHPRPLGVAAPFDPLKARWDEEKVVDGKQKAQDEWLDGKAILYTHDHVNPRNQLYSRAIPLRRLTDRTGNQGYADMLRGHNREIWHLLREEPSRFPAVSWLSEVFSLEETWAKRGKQAIKLDQRKLGVLVPHDTETIRMAWLPEVDSREDTLRQLDIRDGHHLSRPERGRPTKPELVWETGVFSDPATVRGVVWPETKGVEVLWLAKGSGAFIMRLRDPDDREMPYRLYAVDLRTGEVLNAAASG